MSIAHSASLIESSKRIKPVLIGFDSAFSSLNDSAPLSRLTSHTLPCYYLHKDEREPGWPALSSLLWKKSPCSLAEILPEPPVTSSNPFLFPLQGQPPHTLSLLCSACPLNSHSAAAHHVCRAHISVPWEMPSDHRPYSHRPSHPPVTLSVSSVLLTQHGALCAGFSWWSLSYAHSSSFLFLLPSILSHAG